VTCISELACSILAKLRRALALVWKGVPSTGDSAKDTSKVEYWRMVTDVDCIVQTVRVFSVLMPCPTKLFRPSVDTQAHAWITAAS
jgi:hypothetical protein